MRSEKPQSVALPSRYPGGKNGAGVFQTIINQIPPHDLYIEAFAGSASVLRKKAPAPCSIAIERDALTADRLRAASLPTSTTVISGDAREFLSRREWTGREFLYCDPPYVRSARRSPGSIYRFEFSDADHKALLALLVRLPCAVMISGYRCALYDEMLAGWRRLDFNAMTRGGPAVESLWMNYARPTILLDYRYLGRDFREREKLKRRRTRWRARLERMPELERQGLLDALLELAAPKVAMPAGAGILSPVVARPPVAAMSAALAVDGEGISPRSSSPVAAMPTSP